MHQGLTYFVELPGHRLRRLIERPGLLERLQATGAALSVAMLDLSSDRRLALRACAAHHIPLTAWLVLDPSAGYWLTADNAPLARRRYQEVDRWAHQAGVAFEAIGLDLEPPHDDALALMEQGQRALIRLFQGRRSPRALAEAARQYQALVESIRVDGYRVETYQFPLILDERRAGSTLTQRTLGLVDLKADREVLMLYESLLPPRISDAMIDVYGAEAEGIAVGITGGGVEFVLRAVGGRRLSFRRLVRGLRRAGRYTPHRYVFSLEGCVEAGYFEELCEVRLDQPAPVSGLRPAGAVVRMGLRAALRLERLSDRLMRRGTALLDWRA